MRTEEEQVGLFVRVPKEQRELLHQARLRVKREGKHLTIQQFVKEAIDQQLKRFSL